ncbi:MAG TPA: hypothetical protein VLA29_13430 [Acidimicrobiia bacterium]|nr:hypothetical protein [Acidimicrobiia bacterium]
MSEPIHAPNPWEGFWQVLYDSTEEEVVSFRDTTTAVRPALGFSILTSGTYMELRSTGRRQPPQGWPPTEHEKVAMLRDFTATAGPATWEDAGSRWRGAHTITMASDPRLEGGTTWLELSVDGEYGVCDRSTPDGIVRERWRRLSARGTTPLAGAWRSGEPDAPWLYVVTAGHFGVMNTEAGRPRAPANGEWSDSEVLALWDGFGANAGARLETDATFDHWPMLGNMAGYEVRKHETFRVGDVHPDRFTAFLPPFEEGQEWRRVD